MFFLSLFMVVCVCIADPDEVDTALLQLCSSQLKLLQLYTDIQRLHSAADIEACSKDVRTHTHTKLVNGTHVNIFQLQYCIL